MVPLLIPLELLTYSFLEVQPKQTLAVMGPTPFMHCEFINQVTPFT